MNYKTKFTRVNDVEKGLRSLTFCKKSDYSKVKKKNKWTHVYVLREVCGIIYDGKFMRYQKETDCEAKGAFLTSRVTQTSCNWKPNNPSNQSFSRCTQFMEYGRGRDMNKPYFLIGRNLLLTLKNP